VDKMPIINIPIKKINFQNNTETDIHNKIITYVKKILDIYNEDSKTVLSEFNDAINIFENEINKLIYKLYGLDKNEINLIDSLE